MTAQAPNDRDRAIARLFACLSAGGAAGLSPAADRVEWLAGADLAVPDWIERCDLFRDDSPAYWLLVEARAEAPRPAGGQLTVGLAPGRYLIDTLDADAARWIARESAAGPRLVVGVICPGRAAVLRIRPVSQEER